MEAPARFADLQIRVASGVVLASGALALLWAGGVWTAGLVAALAGVSVWEWRRMTATGGVPAWVLATTGAGIVVLSHPAGFVPALAALGMAAIAILAADWARGARADGGWAAGGLVVILVAGLALLALRRMDPFGFETAFWVVLTVALTDTGAYFAGRLIGGPKIWPSVSPKKTWAGLGGGVALAFFGGGLFSWATTGTYFYEVCTVSAVAAVLAQGGDLAQSALKRRFGRKDTGRLIPGHGGALDRVDGLMAATLVAGAVTLWRGKAVFIW